MSQRRDALSYSVRITTCAKYVGQLCLALAGLTLVPLGVALALGDFQVALRYAAVVGGLGAGGALLARLPRPRRVETNEGMVVVTLMFLIAPLVMTYPVMTHGLDFEDALFETISGTTTTGLSTRADVEAIPASLLFARAWTQWYGGLGIMVLALGLVRQSGLVAKGLASAEADPDDLAGGVRAHARRVAVIYSLLSLLGIAILWIGSGDFFESVLYGLAAISTGGFAPHNDSLAGADAWPWHLGVTLVCLLGATPFSLYHRLFREGVRLTPELRQLGMLLLCGLLFSGLFGACLWREGGWTLVEIVRQAPVMVFSAQTTAGFSSLDLAQMGDGAKLSLLPAMAVGGGIGSTAGGIKILRLMILFKVIQAMLARLRSSRHAIVEARLGRRVLGEGEIADTLLLILLFILVVFVSWFPFVLLGYPAVDALFEVLSATGTVGLSSGLTSAELPSLLKAVLCADMLLGRLEIFAWLVLFHPHTWLGRRKK